MRIRELLVVGAMALPMFAACKKSGSAGDAGPEAAPSESASETASAPVQDAAPEAAVVHHVTVPAIGNACHPGADSVACAPDKLTELTCGGGVWRALQACRGSGGCSGVGSALKCDVGQPIVGDPCVVGQAPSKCATTQELQTCQGGTYRDVVCPPPTKCKPQGNNQFACK
jgi:hypothetical protein